jgi:CyaY protein
MDAALYNQRVAVAFKRILSAADAVDPDVLEADGTPDMVTLTASSGAKCIINTQRAVWQVWVAAQSQGIHFSWDDATSTWRDDKGKGYELFSFVRTAVQQMCGAELTL